MAEELQYADVRPSDLINLFLLTNATKINIPMDMIADFIVQNDIIPKEVILNYNALEGFDEPNGKFPNTLGNVALIDCHYVLSNLEDSLMSIFDRIEDK